MQRIKDKRGRNAVVLPIAVMMLWGSLFPFIKIGYKAFEINTESIPDVLMFASLRFVVCGIIVCLIAYFMKAKIETPKARSILSICLMGIFSIVLHYGFTYVGLTKTDSSKTAILKQIAPLLFACFSFVFVKDEKFSPVKILGAAVGFGGIVSINAGTELRGFSSGDTDIVLASVCTVISMIISGKIVKSTSAFWVTGISQLFGGLILLIISSVFGGNVHFINMKAVLVFAYICVASIIGYTLFYYVQRTAELSRLFIIKFAEPLFACMFGALLLGENIMKIQYLISFILISTGIFLGNAAKNT